MVGLTVTFWPTRYNALLSSSRLTCQGIEYNFYLLDSFLEKLEAIKDLNRPPRTALPPDQYNAHLSNNFI